MTYAAVATQGPFVSQPARVVARIELFDRLDAAEPAWRRLERAEALITPYQQYPWVAHWFAALGRQPGVAPLIVVGFDRADAPSLLLPLVTTDHGFGRIARFCGGRHSNLNLPVWRSDATAELTGPRLTALLAEVAAARHIDLFALTGQPPQWCGVANPFSALPGQRSIDDVYGASLPAGPPFRPYLVSSMRKKERKLARLDGYRHYVPETPDDVVRLLDAFHRQKAARFAQQGIRNVFDSPQVAAFIRAACLDGLAERRPVIELHALEAAGEVLAVVGGVRSPQRYSVMFSSITTGDVARLSPGIVLFADLIADCAGRGIPSFDLGAGQASYKNYFCTGSEQLFDCFVACSARGAALRSAYRLVNGLKRSIKRNAALMGLLHAARRWTTAGRPFERSRRVRPLGGDLIVGP